MRRKRIAVICTVLAAAMIFAACGAQQKKESKKARITSKSKRFPVR